MIKLPFQLSQHPFAAFKKHGHILQTHNRWWAPDNVYAKQNGGDYNFIIEPDAPTIPGPIEIEVEGPGGRPIVIPILDENGYSKVWNHVHYVY